IVVMSNGRIEQAAPPREIFEHPATAFVARFMGDHNVIAGRSGGVVDGMARLDVPEGGSFSAIGAAPEEGQPLDIAVRTDRVRLGEQPGQGLGFTGIVTNIEYRGATVKITSDGAGISDFTAIISDKAFFAAPVHV